MIIAIGLNYRILYEFSTAMGEVTKKSGLYCGMSSAVGAPSGIGREVLVRWNQDCLRKMPYTPPPPRGGRWKLL